jgi:hypothetical protein
VYINLKNVMVQTRKYYLKNHYLTLRSKINVPGRSLWYTTHCLMVMHPYQISLTYLKRWLSCFIGGVFQENHQPTASLTNFINNVVSSNKGVLIAGYGPDKKILFKKPLFDLEVKDQCPRKVIMVHDTLPYGHAPDIRFRYLKQFFLVIYGSF